MNIRNWPMGQIMQLPDNCFGRRFVVSCMVRPIAGAVSWDISEIALPEKSVFWEFCLLYGAPIADYVSVRVALGDQLPTTTAMMDALEPLIPGLGFTGAEPRVIPISYFTNTCILNLRVPIFSAGRRVILEVTPEALKSPPTILLTVFSSIPTEVPDCLLSV